MGLWQSSESRKEARLHTGLRGLQECRPLRTECSVVALMEPGKMRAGAQRDAQGNILDILSLRCIAAEQVQLPSRSVVTGQPRGAVVAGDRECEVIHIE